MPSKESLGSAPSDPDGSGSGVPPGKSADELWVEIQGRFSEVLETQEARLLEEAGFMGLDEDDVASIPAALGRIRPEEKVRIFRELNPHLEVTDPAAALDPYEVAVGVLRIFAEK